MTVCWGLTWSAQVLEFEEFGVGGAVGVEEADGDVGQWVWNSRASSVWKDWTASCSRASARRT